jgi:uncharacterized membrane protein
MDGPIGLMILLALLCLLSGPVALIVSLAALGRFNKLERDMHELAARQPRRPGEIPAVHVPAKPEPHVPVRPEPPREIAPEPVKPVEVEREIPVATPVVQAAEAPRPAPWSQAGLEQRIGTRWVLIAGVITVMFAVGFFLKYAYDQRWIGPLGRVLIAAVGGLIALAVGETTRRRGYGIVAKGVTALGFAILYATVFAAHRWYGLIGSAPAYVLAIAITVAAMSYAVVLDEIVMAMLSLVGGYLTPWVLSTGQNLPTLLFGYVLIFSAGAIICAYWRRWSAVNILAFVGTYLLYTGWFERFYRPAMRHGGWPEQLGVALLWLAVFFLVYLMLPLLHALVRRVKSGAQDIILILVNAAVVFYYLSTMLYDQSRVAMAACSVGLGAAHLLVAGIVIARCREDVDLWRALLVASLVFVTLAVPIYFEAYAVAMLWTVEGLLLAFVGLRYRNMAVQLMGAIVLALAVGDLCTDLPMHGKAFRPVFNAAFGTWCFVAAGVLVAHVLYRLDKRLDPELRGPAAQGLYAAGLGLLMAAVVMELWWHSQLNMPGDRGGQFFWGQMALVFAAFLLLLVGRSLSPRGPLCRTVGMLLALIAATYLAVAFPHFRERSFTIFVNSDFARAMVLVAALFASAWLLRRSERQEADDLVFSVFVAFGAVLVLWILLTEEVWVYYDRLRPSPDGRFLAQMYISVLWAVYATALMVIGFWRRIRPLRYLALGIFLLLLGKIFFVDTRELEMIYRVAGFLATGLALVSVSYLYQYLKKTGFFDAMLAEKKDRGT